MAMNNASKFSAIDSFEKSDDNEGEVGNTRLEQRIDQLRNKFIPQITNQLEQRISDRFDMFKSKSDSKIKDLKKRMDALEQMVKQGAV